MIERYLQPYKLFILFFALLISSTAISQSKKQQQLEEKKQEYLRQIKQLERLVFQGKKEQRSVLSNIENLDFKIGVRQNLIKITNQQANLLTREINNNQKEITNLRNRLKVLKEEYAAMIVKSYKSRSEESKVMFLLSSSNFQQAYKRLQYIKQYANYQKKQSEEIKLQTEKLQKLNIELQAKKQEKQKLVENNRIANAKLDKELKEFEALKSSISKDLSKHTAQIKTRQQEVDRIDREIARLIREAIAKSNKRAGKSTKSTTYAMTPEEKNLAKNFVSNKGRLPWPVQNGLVKVRYGTKPSPIDRTVDIKSNGVRIATNIGAKARAVFEGVVSEIMILKNGNKVVLIQHGNYFTVYKNLSTIYVKKGDKVSTKQDIGIVRTSRITGEATLDFGVWKGLQKLNPAYWINKL